MRTFVTVSKVKAILCCLFIIGCLQSKICAQQFPGFINPGLEGTFGNSIAPPNWSVCANTIDVYPYNGYGIPPSQGNSYVGGIAQPRNYDETFGQQLCEPLKKGIINRLVI